MPLESVWDEALRALLAKAGGVRKGAAIRPESRRIAATLLPGKGIEMCRVVVPTLLLGLLWEVSLGSAAPIRKFDVAGVIARVVPASDAEKKQGILATITLQDAGETIQITKETELNRQMGKLVPKATLDDLKEGRQVSVWILGKPEKTDPLKGKAEAVLIFPKKE